MTDADLERGRLMGRVDALEEVARNHKERMDSHAQRLRILERLAWLVTGGFAVVSLLPKAIALFEALK